MATIKILGEFYLSRLLGTKIYDSSGQKVGKILDMAVHWEDSYPRIVGIKYKKRTQQLIRIEQIAACNYEKVQLKTPFSIQENILLHEHDIYISKWLLDKQIIDLKGSKLVRVNDIVLSWITEAQDSYMTLVAVDIGLRGLFRRLGLEFLTRHWKNTLLDLQYVNPLENWNAYLQLNREKNQISQLHPADIADLLEEMDYKTRAGIIETLDDQQAIDAIVEMDLDTQVELIAQMDEQRASDLLEEMPTDEAADILVEMSIEKSEGLLKLMESDDAQEVRELMKYEEGTAGALMTTEYISFSAELTVSTVIEKLRELAPKAETIYYLYIVNESAILQGVLSLRELVIAAPDRQLRDLMNAKLITVLFSATYHEVAKLINKYGLLAVPVLDITGVMLGIVTVDDVIEELLPEPETMELHSWFSLNRRGGRK